MEEISFKATVRSSLGRAATRRLRGEGYLPINVYGHKQKNRFVAVDYRAFEKFLLDGHRILTLEVDGAKEHGVVREVQFDSLGTTLVHADIARVDLEEHISMSVPIVTIGISKGQNAGGMLYVSLKEVHIEGPARAIPEKIEFRVTELEVNDSIRIRNLEIPASCSLAHDPDDMVLAIHERIAIEEEEAPAAEVPEEPEVISRKKEEDEESGG